MTPLRAARRLREAGEDEAHEDALLLAIARMDERARARDDRRRVVRRMISRGLDAALELEGELRDAALLRQLLREAT
jgi:hypothetical protein